MRIKNAKGGTVEMVTIEIDGQKRLDYEVKELIIIGDSIKISLKKKMNDKEKEAIINLNTGSYQQQNNPVLEIRNDTQPNPSQILCETQAYQDFV